MRMANTIQTLFAGMGLVVLAGCGGNTDSFGRDVDFVHPDEIEEPGVADAARGVVKLGLYDHHGTGFFISGDGYLLTNHHVAGNRECPGNCAGLKVFYRQERGQQQTGFEGARLLFSDEDIDLALLKVATGPDGVHFVALSGDDPDLPVEEGWEVHITGHPFATLKKDTAGPLEYRSGADYLIDNFAFPGNSGSPLLDPQGRAIGLVKAIWYRIGDIDLKGRYGESGIAATMTRILEKYPFLAGLNVQWTTAEDRRALEEALAVMTDGLPLDEQEVLGIEPASLSRDEIGPALALLANGRAAGSFDRVAAIWERVQDRTVFEEDHRFFAGQALVTLADDQARRALALELLGSYLDRADPDWIDLYLELIHELGTPEAVELARDGILAVYQGYELSPWLASLLLSFGFTTVSDVELLGVVEELFKSLSERAWYAVAQNLDEVRFDDPADEQRAIDLLLKMTRKSQRVRGIYHAEQALYNRGRIVLR